MEFLKYQHLEKLGTTEVENIELGLCYVFPKLDGTNASVWFKDGAIQGGSRNRHLSIDNDNAGFLEYAHSCEHLNSLFKEYPHIRLYGEWLVPHAIKNYKDDSWRKFYVFDVCYNEYYLPYDDYKEILEKFNINYIPCIAKVNNGSYDQFVNQLQYNTFLMVDGEGIGEGIVIKNYEVENKYGRKTWAKLVTSEFKEKRAKVHGGHKVQGKKLIEEEIANKFVTSTLVEKEFHKIENEQQGWTGKSIPRLLNTIYYCIVKEECWEFVKEFKNPSIDFKRLQHFVFEEVKKKKPELF